MQKMTNNTKIFPISKKVKMKKIYCVVCDEYRKENSFKEVESIEILKVIGSIKYIQLL